MKSTSTFEPPSQATAAFDPWVFWVTFRRCWWFAIPIGTMLSGLMALYVLKSFVPIYSASHLLEANQDFVVFQHVMPAVKNLASTEKALFFNAIVLDPVLAEPSCRTAPSLSDPATAESNLKQNLRVTSGGTESRLLVSYKDSDPVAAANICNIIVESYLRQRDAFDNTRVSNLERWLEPEIQRWEQAVEERQRIVQKCSEQTLGYAPGGQAALMESQSNFDLATSLRAQITELNLKISVDEAKLAMKSANDRQLEQIPGPDQSDLRPTRVEPTKIQIEKLVSADERVIDAKNQLRKYRDAMLAIEDLGQVGIRRSEYKRYERRFDYFNDVLRDSLLTARLAAIEKLKQASERSSNQEFSSRKEQLAQQQLTKQRDRIKQLEKDRLEIDVYKTKLSVIQNQYQLEKERLEKYGGATAELQFAQEELGVATDVLRKLRTRVAAIRTERRQDGAVRSLAPATTPRTPIETVPLKKLVMYCGAAMAIPFLLGLLWELRVQRITSSSMCQELGLTVVAEVPKLPTERQLDQGRRLFQESIDALRASLSLSTQSATSRSIAIVSSMSGEGKSSIASQLAIAIAKASGNKVLLVDADLRCPEQNQIFGVNTEPGLSEVISGTTSLTDAVNNRTGNSIHVLPSGSIVQNRHRVINAEAIKKLVDEALQHYQYIVFDTAPVLSAGETLALASAVDTTLLCVMRDVSRVDNVKRATKKLASVNAKTVGAVFSGISSREYVLRYGDYYSPGSLSKMQRVA